jgi:hypothetical protein
MTTDKNRFVAEKLGLCDICDDKVCELLPECGCYVFDDDAGAVQLLRLMMEREDWSTFHYYGLKSDADNDRIQIGYITIKGKLLEAVWEWSKEHPR